MDFHWTLPGLAAESSHVQWTSDGLSAEFIGNGRVRRKYIRVRWASSGSVKYCLFPLLVLLMLIHFKVDLFHLPLILVLPQQFVPTLTHIGDIQTGSIEPLSAEGVTTADAEDSIGQTSFTAYEMSLLCILKVPINHMHMTGAKSLQKQ